MLILAGLAMVAAATGYWWYRASGAPRLVADTLCPEKGPSGVVVVLLDRSDPLTIQQREGLRNRLMGLRDGLSQHERLDVYAVGDTTTTLRDPVVSLCNPGKGDDANVWTSNPRLMRQRWEKRFADRIDSALADVLMVDTAESQSPVMESLQSVAITALGRIPAETPRRLVIVSDMIQHTREYSQYRGVGNFESFRSTPYFERMSCDLGGAEVTILYLNRAPVSAVQGKAHIAFWRDYIAAMNGQLVSVVRIEG